MAQLKVLDLIERGEALRSTDIAQALGQAPRTVTEALDGLERDGLIARIVDEQDRRAKRINLTEEGRRVLRDAAPCREAYMIQFLEVLSGEEKAIYLRMLHMLNDRLVEMGALPVLST
ncbi:MAG: MarR family transcriptional regulator [Sphingobium sp.]